MSRWAVYDALTSRGLVVPQHSTVVGSSIASDNWYDQVALFPATTKKWLVNIGVFDFDAVVFRELWARKGQKVFNEYVRYYLSDHRVMWVDHSDWSKRLNDLNPNFREVFVRAIVEFRCACRIIGITWRHEDDHTLPCTREEHPIRIDQVLSSIGAIHILPTGPAERMVAPPTAGKPQVRIPRHASPIQLETLNLELGGCVFEVPGRPCVGSIIQKPMDWVDFNADIHCMRLESLCAG